MNFGEMEFDTYDSGGAGGSLYNNCMLFVEHMKAGGIVYLDHGVIAEEKEDDEENELFEEADDIEFYDNAKVTLANGSMIKAKNIIAKSGLSVNGEGNETSLLKATEKVQIQIGMSVLMADCVSPERSVAPIRTCIRQEVK